MAAEERSGPDHSAIAWDSQVSSEKHEDRGNAKECPHCDGGTIYTVSADGEGYVTEGCEHCSL